MATHKEVQAVFLQMRDRLLEHDNVIGVGIGDDEQDGIATGRLAIVVLTLDDRPERRPQLPAHLGDVPVVVRKARLTEEEHLAFLERNGIRPEQGECNIDQFLLSDSKIHQLNLARLRRGGRGARLIRGDEPGDEPGDSPADDPGDPAFAIEGDIFVIEDDGTLIVDTTIDHVAAYDFFRTQFGDHYDFLFFHYDTASGVPSQGNSSPTVFNDIVGINNYKGDSYDDRATWSSTRIQSIQKITSLSQVRRMLHETAHRWCSYVYHREGGVQSDKLHREFSVASQAAYHWGDWFDDHDSCMDYDYFDWVDSALVAGEFQKDSLSFGPPGTDEYGYHPLDLYLMGLMSAAEVGTFRYIDSPSDPDSNGSFAGTAVSLTVTNITDEEGARNPAYPDTQRVFHQAFILITNDLAGIGDLTDTATPLGNMERYRKGFLDAFRRKTMSRATIDGSLLRSNFESIYIRDNSADSGAASSTGAFWNSPDIWVRRNDDSGTDHESPVRGQDNFLHARVHNASATDYDNVIVRFYRANFVGTEFYFPEDWHPDELIGEATIDVPASGSAVAKVTWSAAFIPDATWHPCLLVELVPMEVTPELRHHVWDNRKLAQKNITIVDPPGDAERVQVDFAFGHPTRLGDRFALLTVARTADLPGLALELDLDGLQFEVERDSARLPGSAYLPRGGGGGSGGGGGGGSIFPWSPWWSILAFLRWLLSLLGGRRRIGRVGEPVPVDRDGRLVYRLPDAPLIGLRVRPIAGRRAAMALHADLGRVRTSARGGLVQVTQSDEQGRVVGGFDVAIRP